MWVLPAGLAVVVVLMARQGIHLQEPTPVPVVLAARLVTILMETHLLRGRLPAHGKAHQFNWSKHEQR